ncbi:hypothetical protein [Companilactobacillus versmoldensis]|uniref:PepSY domain-containing protein n=1 Tax=Companilactobacillus versmoldensis DSM 14857 = KCTC 3814 TaxID=1423815 RepID=A0A0R1SGG6_9LACO|nr:hypothetical protein [Companilactobacillus versmoldensis]KRL68321.1 hypothetical protein FC27_GL000016 [Companilactobacillus versmoldensis DSM 14857 = KCTC 3814]
MSKKGIGSVIFAGTALVAGAAATVLVKHHLDSEKIINKVKSVLGEDSKFIGSWVEPFYQRVDVNGQSSWGIVGGVTTMDDFDVSQYHFIADAISGELLNIKKVQ